MTPPTPADTLLPCPFCGNMAGHMDCNSYGHCVDCTRCGSRAGYYASKESAFAAWNTRRPSPSEQLSKSAREVVEKMFSHLIGNGCLTIPPWLVDQFSRDVLAFASIQQSARSSLGRKA